MPSADKITALGTPEREGCLLALDYRRAVYRLRSALLLRTLDCVTLLVRMRPHALRSLGRRHAGSHGAAKDERLPESLDCTILQDAER